MAVVGVAVSYVVYQVVYRLSGKRPWGIFLGGFLAAWFSIEIAALGVGLQLAISGTSPANIAIPAMAAIHAIIGIGEGLITTGVLAFVYATRPDLITRQEGRPSKVAVVWVVGLVIALALAILSPLASANPDGLEWVAEQKGFLDTAQGAVYNIIPDYVLPGIPNEALATILAGILGVILVLGVAMGIGYLRRNRHQPTDQ
jgi:cobalt/nickel transport system permease protein